VRRVLGTVYHTTFAAGICCATLITCNSIPPHVASVPADSSEVPPGKGDAWKINWNTSPPELREKLDFLSLAFSLRRALEEVDLVRIRQLLEAAAEVGLLGHPLFTQTVELLERISVADITASSH